MDPALRRRLAELYEFGQHHDSTTADRAARMLNITPDTGEFLRALVIAGSHRRVLELGTSNGYSTIWLADACRATGGLVHTVEHDAAKQAMALANLQAAGLDPFVELRPADIGVALPELRDFDLVFLDSDRAQYVAWWSHLRHAVRPGGLLVVDNATSHAAEVAAFVETVNATAGFNSVLLPLGNGELLILREPVNVPAG